MFAGFSNKEEDFDFLAFRKAVYVSFLSCFLMWVVKFVELGIDQSFGVYGIYPRSLKGSIGILTSPFIHNDFFHLASNSIPFISLMLFLFYYYKKIALEVFLWIYFTTGVWVWAFAREAYHIGASGIVYGLATFLLASGFISKNVKLIAASLIVVFMYGGLFYGINPNWVSPDVSWESHLIGSVTGVFMAVFFRKSYCKSPVDIDDDDDEDPKSDIFYSSTSEEKVDFNYEYKEYARKVK